MGTIKNHLKPIVFSFVLLFFGCIEEDKFGLSEFKQIKAFEIPGQASATTILPAEQRVVIPFDEGEDVTALTPSRIDISNLASIDPGPGETRDFSQPVIYTVTAEDGSQAAWEVSAVVAEPQPQLPNSNFDLWYNAGGYQQPGESEANTIWDTANPGLAIVGGANTTPEDLGGGDFAAKMVSVRAPLFVRMAAATLYTGSFKDGFPNPSDPRSNIDFGATFTARPRAFRVAYRYLPGPEHLDGDGNALPGGDQADLYLLLENRDGDQVARVGTAWFRSGDTVEDWSTIEVPVKYGPLTPSDPEFDYANIRPGETWADPEARPTHITVVFSSSALGDFFTGAIGSELWVNDFELLY